MLFGISFFKFALGLLLLGFFIWGVRFLVMRSITSRTAVTERRGQPWNDQTSRGRGNR
jgi:hypothetical protein